MTDILPSFFWLHMEVAGTVFSSICAEHDLNVPKSKKPPEDLTDKQLMSNQLHVVMFDKQEECGGDRRSSPSNSNIKKKEPRSWKDTEFEGRMFAVAWIIWFLHQNNYYTKPNEKWNVWRKKKRNKGLFTLITCYPNLWVYFRERQVHLKRTNALLTFTCRRQQCNKFFHWLAFRTEVKLWLVLMTLISQRYQYFFTTTNVFIN